MIRRAIIGHSTQHRQLFARHIGGMAQLVRSSTQEGVQLIGINRPEKRNCVNHATALQLIEAFEAFEKNDEAKVAVIYGEGGNFCAGYDLSTVAAGDIKVDPDFFPKYRYMGPTNMKLRKPLIAAVEGFAVAGGLELALLADLRVAASSAIFGVYCRRVGVPLIDGGTVRLPRIIGAGRALDMILTGRPVSASEALQWGLVNRYVEDGKALESAIALAKEIIKHPQACMRLDRQSMYASLDLPFDEAMEEEFESADCLPEAVAEAQKFMDKKIPPPSKL